MQDKRARAPLLDEARDVGGENKAAASPPMVDFVERPLLKTLVADGDDLVDQIAIKVDRKGQGKIEPSLHAAGIRIHRFGQIFPKLGEIIDKSANFADRLVVDAGDEPDRVVTGHPAGHAAGQADWPG